jgi:2-polyprenyl-6-methoxyphenol hydroxylase-like FAD-dependent oxidoreductase
LRTHALFAPPFVHLQLSPYACARIRLGCTPFPADVGEDWSEGQPVSGVKYKAADGSVREARAHLTVVCDGMYSNFRKPLTESADIHHPSFFVGLLLRNVQLPYANHGHVVLAEPSPVLFYPISPTEVRGCSEVTQSQQQQQQQLCKLK